ncbi:L-serine ammonia-lyase [Shewanella schlegeliana]|uniref:L-serine dehydratase n=1 Tax=Shewanella schlegeliana TaxID=190308 RepID=A0ABS1SV81_9GAMM|nr:L-serine ammonia-lyase [Shewanella schlegeliana]MBL4912435.1 L-serine ammonia-lyase [Shewanella schlegeliana]MCL1108095.1 L-serine ammonia-lyase [Shewanella schlegeliana]GIU21766.1 L-serine ammonia-lyase [Shewanella schlegeliana]
MFSAFDIFKIGVGPSSSHTVGPMKAAKEFVDDVRQSGQLEQVTRLGVEIFGSLSLTGKGHHTDIAIIVGLGGNSPESVDIDAIPGFIAQVEQTQKLPMGQEKHLVDFGLDAVLFHDYALPLHENGMKLHAYKGDELLMSKTYYSTGGGFIVEESKFGKEAENPVEVPYPFNFADELLATCQETGMSISSIMFKNELAFNSEQAIYDGFGAVWETMRQAIEKGCQTEGVLAGPLKVARRAPALYRQLLTGERLSSDPMEIVDWINVFAMAVSEENAAGGRVVTSPTNGAAGIIPAVLAYYDKFIKPVGKQEYTRFFLAAAAIGSLYKRNASISGAEVGCQGEVGVACSMAAAGLAEIMGGNAAQVCMAAEIGMEHNLGLTCDPVAGQVQVPCIERNAIAAVKAINSSRMAMRRNCAPKVSLDKVIATMLETGKDMHVKYRETSQGGLAIKVTSICG